MGKFSDSDIYNCSSCGYGTCEKMAIAIFNGLNKTENCHHFARQSREKAIANEVSLVEKISTTMPTISSGIDNINSSIIEVAEHAKEAQNVAADAAIKANKPEQQPKQQTVNHPCKPMLGCLPEIFCGCFCP